ncbi:MAG: hypothetical protein IIA35_04205 [Proteobacteria bacterium]|nr:hypothetical protein [Pseudomonadota bacterium]
MTSRSRRSRSSRRDINISGNEFGGDLTRLAVSRAAPVGRLHAFRPLKEVTQLAAVKK